MPKVKLARYAEKEDPPIDWLWAAVLERKMQFGWDLAQMAVAAGTSYDWMRQNIRKSPWEWNKEARERLCDAMSLKPIRTVEGAPREEWRK